MNSLTLLNLCSGNNKCLECVIILHTLLISFHRAQPSSSGDCHWTFLHHLLSFIAAWTQRNFSWLLCCISSIWQCAHITGRPLHSLTAQHQDQFRNDVNPAHDREGVCRLSWLATRGAGPSLLPSNPVVAILWMVSSNWKQFYGITAGIICRSLFARH